MADPAAMQGNLHGAPAPVAHSCSSNSHFSPAQGPTRRSLPFQDNNEEDDDEEFSDSISTVQQSVSSYDSAPDDPLLPPFFSELAMGQWVVSVWLKKILVVFLLLLPFANLTFHTCQTFATLHHQPIASSSLTASQPLVNFYNAIAQAISVSDVNRLSMLEATKFSFCAGLAEHTFDPDTDRDAKELCDLNSNELMVVIWNKSHFLHRYFHDRLRIRQEDGAFLDQGSFRSHKHTEHARPRNDWPVLLKGFSKYVHLDSTGSLSWELYLLEVTSYIDRVTVLIDNNRSKWDQHSDLPLVLRSQFEALEDAIKHTQDWRDLLYNAAQDLLTAEAQLKALVCFYDRALVLGSLVKFTEPTDPRESDSRWNYPFDSACYALSGVLELADTTTEEKFPRNLDIWLLSYFVSVKASAARRSYNITFNTKTMIKYWEKKPISPRESLPEGVTQASEMSARALWASFMLPTRSAGKIGVAVGELLALLFSDPLQLQYDHDAVREAYRSFRSAREGSSTWGHT